MNIIQFKSQISINIDNSAPDSSAKLEVKSDTKGMLIPRLTTTQRADISNKSMAWIMQDWLHFLVEVIKEQLAQIEKQQKLINLLLDFKSDEEQNLEKM